MTQEEKINIIDRIHHLIRRKATGKPYELAQRLNVSERTIYNIILEMKRMDAPIYFSTNRNSYCYEYEVEFVIGFLSKQEYDKKTVDIKKIAGGTKYNENIFEKNIHCKISCSEL